MEEAFTPGSVGHEICDGLKTAPDDLVVAGAGPALQGLTRIPRT